MSCKKCGKESKHSECSKCAYQRIRKKKLADKAREIEITKRLLRIKIGK